MAKKELIIVAESPLLIGIDEVCDICNITYDTINSLVEYEIIHPQRTSSQDWVFDLSDLKRIRTALRMQHDLEMNLQSVAIVLKLLDEMQGMRSELELLERHFTKLS